MLKSYLTVAWRNMFRNKVFSLINVSGLAIGMAVVFLIYQYVQVELSYDSFHKNATDLYRVTLSYSGSFASQPPSATNHPSIGPALKATYPEVKDYARFSRANMFFPATTFEYQPKGAQPVTFNEERVYLADAAFLTMFSFPMKEGSADQALKEKLSIVITRDLEKKYFGQESAVGKPMTLNKIPVTVTGVLENLPENSHLQFDVLISFASLGPEWGFTEWTFPEFYNYVQLQPGADAKALETKLPVLMEKNLGKIWEEQKFKSAIALQPILDIHLRSNLALEQSTNGSERSVYFLTLLGVFVLAIAWINYVNLSTAKALERSKEVGLRKVSGATRKQLIVQFFSDALLVNMLAVMLAVGILMVAIPPFESLTGKNISSVLAASGAWLSFSFWKWVVITLLAGVIIVGFYPALLLSSFNPAQVLKGKFSKSTSGVSLRKGMVAFQYILSIFLIAGTITISRQMSYMQQKDLGYDKEQMLIVRGAAIFDSTYTKQIGFFKNEVKQIASVANVSASGEVPGQQIEYRNSVRLFSQDQKDNTDTFIVELDDQFLSAYSIPIVAGRGLTKEDIYINANPRNNGTGGNQPSGRPQEPPLFTAEGFKISGNQNRIMINEDLAKNLGFEKPEEALHQLVRFSLGRQQVGEVVGVVKNYNQLSLHDKYNPILYTNPPENAWKFFSVKINNGKNLAETIKQVKTAYATSFPNNAFQYFFLDDHFNKQYQTDLQFANIFGVFTGLAIIIACLGLFGLGMFNVTQRIKEIGIRKVLGASSTSILLLFSGDSVKLVLLSYAIAVPAIYFAAQNWLSNFAFHIGMQWQMFLIPPLFLVSISIVTIVFITLKAALANPAKALKTE